MGPGRLTGMNAREVPEACGAVEHLASMGPGRLTGMNDGGVALAHASQTSASMGPGRLTGMNGTDPANPGRGAWLLQWGPVD